jgi:hypothetical protein
MRYPELLESGEPSLTVAMITVVGREGMDMCHHSDNKQSLSA